MTKPITQNALGHRTRYDLLAAEYSPEDAAKLYVGTELQEDTRGVGFLELELLRMVMGIDGLVGTSVVDIGCGIGRLTQFLVHEPIREYLGLDILPEVLDQAAKAAKDDPRFTFKIPSGFVIPKRDASADVIAGFASVCANLLDEEMFDYIEESFRVVHPKGAVMFSFQDIATDCYYKEFILHAGATRQGHGHGDLLRWFTKDFLEKLARGAGFKRIEFIGGDVDLHHTGQACSLMGATKSTEETFQFTQSLMVMRK